ncbi:HlyD family type I secretion periplasmic adaptor subunit [Ensifer sp. HO-A22]|uniref:Membrane fusion protein (MFP) family protein n=1 Tax=Ensifer oleiphilus TaxID=2742698 RepID=A0A7Y6QD15_9HYPH|nr:HlyD family type I secretion periplasmic adaptor subunit [Ensifer oleiphilus]NVD43384.1 HlyD family type I secretion periplasmic adaptor subunit [Ensifer oleiphilus]
MNSLTSSSWERTLRSHTGTVAVVGYALIGLFLGGAGFWAATAPIAGATVAAGHLAASGRNVLIQHLEGGVVREIRIKEGDRIVRGQTLIVLDDTAARTQLNRLVKQWMTFRSRASRLEAERDGVSRLAIAVASSAFAHAPDAAAAAIEQEKEFDARLARFRSETEILGQRVLTLEKALSGLTAQKEAIGRQATIVAEEAVRKKKLLDQGLTNRSEYTQLLRVEADLLGQAGAIEAQLATNSTQIAEANEQIERLKTQRVEQAVTALNETRVSLADVEEQLEAAKAVLDRTVVKAPIDGIVITSQYNAIGSVIGTGEKVMEILPTDTGLLIDARLNPQDIDVVTTGQSARLRVSALNARLTPELPARVVHISADRLTDPATQQPYYRALLQIVQPMPEDVETEQLRPGMPVEVFVDTGERTFLEYLAKPIIDSFSRAFVEE